MELDVVWPWLLMECVIWLGVVVTIDEEKDGADNTVFG
jgi:hypothetical protein